MNILQRASWIADTARDQVWLLRRFHLKPTDLVLDVGSGGSPNIRSNVLCDKFVGDCTERNGQQVVVDRPFVVGEGERLPFADRSFDFVICSHVLEHVENPGAVLRELQRVAPRGYIETPSANWEKVQGFPFHRWLVSIENGVLRFEGKSSRLWDEDLRRWFSSTQRTLGIERRVWFARRRLGIYTSLVWEEEIAYEMGGADSSPSSVFDHAAVMPWALETERTDRDTSRQAITWLGKRLRRSSDRPWTAIQALLRCPDCRAPLQRRDIGTYRCNGCDCAFPVDSLGRPWLLPGQQAELGSALAVRSI